jgi:hypothetical protein
MSWEKRGRQAYYYQVFRRNGRLEKRYVGRGASAAAIAKQDATRRAERAAARQAEWQQRQAFDAKLAQLAEMAAEVDAAVVAALAMAGYHRPQRKPWRKRRASHKS